MILREEDGLLKIETEDGWVDYEPDTTVPDFVDADWLAKGQEQTRKLEALAYLTSTDWYVVRKAEAGTEIPSNISELRQQARLNASS